MTQSYNFGDGPDRCIETDNIMAWNPEAAVKLRITSSDHELPISVVTYFQKTVRKFPNHPALKEKIDGVWKEYTYKEYNDRVMDAAKSFIKLGLQPHHGVGILGFNSPEWFISNLATIFAGGLATGIYTTNSSDACQYVAENAKCNIIVVENDAQLQKILKVCDKLPYLKCLIQYKGEVKIKSDQIKILSWKELLDIGSNEEDDELNKRISNLAPNKCCTLIYTSGTTGNPKGAMLTHDNLVWSSRVLTGYTKCKENGVLLSYLPLSHIAAQIIDVYCSITNACTVYFAQPDVFKGSLGPTLKEVQPVFFLGVPRVWEKMHETINSLEQKNSKIKRFIVSKAKNVGLKAVYNKMAGNKKKGIYFGLAKNLVFNNLRKALGLNNCNLCITGAAPILKETLEFFYSLNIPLLQVYGMSECTGAHTLELNNKYCIGSVGKEYPEVQTCLRNIDDNGNGEINIYGRHVFMGYLNEEVKTKEVIDSEGWLSSGDLGRKDEKDFLFITGRIKELIITAGGENVAPVMIEDKVREYIPCVSNCMLIGDKKKFLSMIITLKCEIDKEIMQSKDELSPISLNWCKSIGSECKTVSEIIRTKDRAVYNAIEAKIKEINKTAMSNAQVIQKWIIIAKDFSITGGELGPTMKLKRNFVMQKYEKEIDQIYA